MSPCISYGHKSSGSRGDTGRRADVGRRSKKVAAQVFEVLSMAVTAMLEDPRLLDISVTHVDLTMDLSLARVYVSSAVADTDLDAAVSGLQNASGFLRKQLASQLNLRKVPELRFFPDNVLRDAWKLDEVIAGLSEDDKDSGS